jgi:hypothetical protein
VKQDDSGVIVSQRGYALKILAVASMEGCNPSHTPMENRLKLSKSSTATLSILHNIALRYNTRPDWHMLLDTLAGSWRSPQLNT